MLVDFQRVTALHTERFDACVKELRQQLINGNVRDKGNAHIFCLGCIMDKWIEAINVAHHAEDLLDRSMKVQQLRQEYNQRHPHDPA